MTYDALNRLTQVTYADASTTSYTFDAGNRLTQIVDSVAGTITYGFDNLDRLTSETTPQGICIGYHEIYANFNLYQRPMGTWPRALVFKHQLALRIVF